MSRSFLRTRRDLAANEAEALETAGPSELTQLDRGGEATALAQGAPAEVEGEDSLATASGLSDSPADADESDWRERFDTPEEMWERFRNVDRLRGRLANEVGFLRRQLRLVGRLDELLEASVDPVEAKLLASAKRALVQEIDRPNGEHLDRLEMMVALGEGFHDSVVSAGAEALAGGGVLQEAPGVV
jgi:hypothetical protein